MNKNSIHISIKITGIVLLVLIAGISITIAKDIDDTINSPKHPYDSFICGTRSDHLLHLKADKIHALRKSQLNKIQFVAKATADRDDGDVAIIEDDGTLILPPSPANPFDMDKKTLLFTRNTSGGYNVSQITFAFDASIGFKLSAGDDTSHEFIPRGFSFPFFGTNWTKFWVRSNGIVTFGSVPSSTAFDPDDFDLEIPSIAAFFLDLDPSVTTDGSAGVFVKTSATEVVITWNKLPEFNDSNPNSNSNTIQLTLRNTGEFEVTYESIDIIIPSGASGTLIVGYNSGNSDPSELDVDFSTLTIGGSPLEGSSFDILSELFRPQNILPLVDYQEVVNKFYKTHDDIFDQVVMFTNFSSDLGGGFAFHLGVSNSVQGINRDIEDFTATWGSTTGRLKSFLNMNAISVWNPDPAAKFFLDGNSFLSILAQEAGHRWLAFVNFSAAGDSSDLMLGRGLAHWSRYAFTESSSLEGNDWVEDTSPTTFVNASVVNGFSNLDLYLMGYLSPEEVPDFFYIDSESNNTISSRSLGSISKGGIASGIRTDVSIDDIIAVEGLRTPDRDFAQKDYQQAFILLVDPSAPATDAEISKLQNFIDAWEEYWNLHTDGRGTMTTNLSTQLPVASIEGLVRDNSTNLILPNFQAELVEKGIKQPVISGGYYTWRIVADALNSQDETFTQGISAYPYFPDTSIITMSFGGTDIKNVSLTKLPTGSISGTITNTLTGLPVETTVFLSIQSDLIDDFILEVNSDASGDYSFDSLFITQPGVITYESITLGTDLSLTAVNINDITVKEGNTVIDIVLNANDILLVNDDPDGMHFEFYFAALDSAGITYNEWRTLDKGLAPTQSTNQLSGFSVTIWYTGDAGLDAISPEEEASLIQFLDGGGRLLITGQNVVESLDSTSRLLTDYFQVSHRGNSSILKMRGVFGNTVTEGFLPFRIDGGDGANNQSSPDILLPTGNASAAIKYGDIGEDISAVTVFSDTFKIFLAGFGLESVVDSDTLTKRHLLLSGILDWLVDPSNEPPFTLPSQFVLEQNYPNPFNPETTIEYFLAENSNVKITIFNILGQRVRSLVNKDLSAGPHSDIWNGSTDAGILAASGIYLYRLEAVSNSPTGNKIFVDTKKMLYLK